jgi:uncharacterized RDD family membrane protein YckC
MEEIQGQPSSDQTETTNVKYGGFWPRLGALLLDGLILSPFTLALSYLNIVYWKSSLLLVFITVVGIMYKPVMEFMFNATLGKMVLNLKVVNMNFELCSAREIALRNIFHILPSFLALLVTIGIYNNPDFESVSGWMEYSRFVQQFSTLRYINYCAGLVGIVDAIMLIADEQKRSLHDRIGGTFVVEQPR